jgi:hypothetical protein
MIVQTHRRRNPGLGGLAIRDFASGPYLQIAHEKLCLHAYDSVADARAGVARYIDFTTGARRVVRLTA